MVRVEKEASEMAEEDFSRFTIFQRIQHFLLAISFFTLALTGFPLKYAHTSWAWSIVDLLGGPDKRGLYHRIAAVVFIGTGLIHVIYYMLIDRGKKDIMPKRKDLYDAVQHIKYNLRMTGEMPKMGRYTWEQKFDYWAGAAGSLIVIVTGLMMWFTFDMTLKVLPLQFVNYARLIHGWEAILAFSFVMVVHLYATILDPDVFPMARQWLIGTLSREQMEHEHPLELEELIKKEET